MMSTSITRRRRCLPRDAGKFRESIFPMEFCIRFTTRMQLGCSTSRPANQRMRRVTMTRLATWCVLLVLVAAIPAYAQKDTVVVRPVEIDDVLVNPGMGITTFQRFNGQALNPLFEWSERGPVAVLPQAPGKPDFPDTSIAYLRWYWSALEPEPGKFHWEIIDLALQEARKHRQTLAIRLIPYSDRDPLPEWYRN